MLVQINTTGLAEIHTFLATHHKLGRAHFTPAMIRAWADDAEEHFMNDEGCYIEIRAMYSKSGDPVVLDISEAGFDVLEVNDK
jgi:hypothetical protein